MKIKVFFLGLAALFSIFAGISLGSVSISPGELFNSPIITEIRFPRVMMAFITGASLSLVGMAFQSILKNPLVDPYLIGISAGASFGAVLSLSMAEFLGYFWIHFSPVMAFLFAVLSSFLALVFAKRNGSISVERLILSGVAMNMFFGSATSFLLYFVKRTSLGHVTWIFGNLSGVVKADLFLPFASVVFFSVYISFQSKKLDAFSFGEDFAKVVGVEAERLKLTIFISGTFLTAVIVSKVGSIGFVGLIVPHVVRMIFGPSHTFGIFASFMIGGSFLTMVDLISRTIASPVEVPIGIITSFVGIPIFLYIMRRGGRRW